LRTVPVARPVRSTLFATQPTRNPAGARFPSTDQSSATPAPLNEAFLAFCKRFCAAARVNFTDCHFSAGAPRLHVGGGLSRCVQSGRDLRQVSTGEQRTEWQERQRGLLTAVARVCKPTQIRDVVLLSKVWITCKDPNAACSDWLLLSTPPDLRPWYPSCSH
jgi:hypothetical protein